MRETPLFIKEKDVSQKCTKTLKNAILMKENLSYGTIVTPLSGYQV